MIVSVIYGGTPEERLPSEKNASDIAHALKTRGHEVHLFRIEKDIISSIITYASRERVTVTELFRPCLKCMVFLSPEAA